MAGKTTIEVVLPAAVVLMAALLASTATAQSSSSCSNTLISLSPCLTYITGNSSTPSSGCCTQLAAVVKNQPECLCQVIAGGGSSIASMNINQTQALALPQACNVQTPPVSRCNVSSPPGSGGAGTSPTTTSSTQGGGSKTTPTTSIETSQGNQSKSTLLVFLTFLFAASIFVKN